MDGLLDRWEAGRITSHQVAIRDATRALVQMEAHRYFHVQVRGQTLSVAENQEPLEREARLDGVFILQGSAQDLDPRAVLLADRQLLWVERAIRSLESFLRVRPVYHFTERRIRAPIFLRVLGYLLENHLRQRMWQSDAGCSARAALEALEPLRVVS
jgi:transposase